MGLLFVCSYHLKEWCHYQWVLPGKPILLVTPSTDKLDKVYCFPYKAILYNDRSVLENHHAATSWELLTSDTKRNFVMDLDPAEYKRLRFLFIEGILATDLKMHFGMIGDFKAKVSVTCYTTTYISVGLW